MPTPIFDEAALAPHVRKAVLELQDETPEQDRPTKAKKPGAGKAAHLVHAAGNLADGLSTYAALRDPRNEEANPLLPNHGGAVLGIKAASILPEALLMRFLAQKGHPKLAKMLGYGLGAAGGAAAVHNIRQIRKDK